MGGSTKFNAERGTKRSKSMSNDSPENSEASNESVSNNKRQKSNSLAAKTPAADHFIHSFMQPNVNHIAPMYSPLAIKKGNKANMHFLNIESCLVDYESQIIYENNSLNKPVISLNDNVFILNEKLTNEPFGVARVMKMVPREPYNKEITLSNIKVFPAYTCDLIINNHFRDLDVSTIARDKLYAAPRELIMSSIVSTVKLSQYRGHVSLTYKSDIDDMSAYLSNPRNFYFNKFYDRFSGELFNVYSIKDLISKYRLGGGEESEYLKLMSKKAPYIYTEVSFPFDEYMRFFMSGENVSKNWRQQCNSCFRWCNYKTNMVKCDKCKELYHVYCVSDDTDKKNFVNKNWNCKNCTTHSNNTLIFNNEKNTRVLNNLKIDLNAKEEFAKNALSLFNKKDCNSQNYMYQYLGFNNSECLASEYKAFFNLDYWHPIKEIQVNTKKCQHIIDNVSGTSDRGGDSSITTIWNPALVKEDSQKKIELNSFTNLCLINIPNIKNFSTAEANFIDEVLKSLNANNLNFEVTYNELINKCDKDYLKIPVFNKKQLHLFEQGIKLFGGDPYKIHSNFLKDQQPLSNVVKFFYIWKKTKHGLITRNKWDKKLKKNQIKQSSSTKKWVYLDSFSCYDIEDCAEDKGYVFNCKFCNCFLSPAWYKCNDDLPKKENVNEALCLRCAKFWKLYGVQWKPFDVLLKQICGRNNWKQTLQRILTEKNFTLELTTNILTQNIEYELLLDMINYIKDNHTFYENSVQSLKKYKKALQVSSSVIKNNTFKFLESHLLEGNEEIGKKKLYDYIENLQMEYSGSCSKKNNKFIKKLQTNFVIADNTYSIKLEFIDKDEDYSVFITKSYDKFVLSGKNSILKLANLLEGDVSVDVSCDTAVVLKSFKLLYEKNTNSMVSIDVTELNSVRPIECQILTVYKAAINQTLKKANALLHSDPQINPIRKYVMEKHKGKKRTKCSVCLTDMSLTEIEKEEIICNCCGMNCHYYCYGEVQETTRDASWQCDSCRFGNESSCSLCVTKETDIESCRKLELNCTPDALKITYNNNKFVHVVCALFTKGIEVSSEKFAPFKNVERLTNIINCKICDSTKGSVVKCGLCDNHYHVTCAQDEESFQIGFTQETNLDPIIVCSSHTNVNLLPLGHKYNGTTLWQLYLKNTVTTQLASRYGNGSYFSNSVKKCAKCDNDTSLYWYSLLDATYCCKNCHLNKIFRNVKLIQGADIENEDVTFWDEYPIDKFYLES